MTFYFTTLSQRLTCYLSSQNIIGWTTDFFKMILWKLKVYLFLPKNVDQWFYSMIKFATYQHGDGMRISFTFSIFFTPDIFKVTFLFKLLFVLFMIKYRVYLKCTKSSSKDRKVSFLYRKSHIWFQSATYFGFFN